MAPSLCVSSSLLSPSLFVSFSFCLLLFLSPSIFVSFSFCLLLFLSPSLFVSFSFRLSSSFRLSFHLHITNSSLPIQVARDDANLSKGYGFVSFTTFEASDDAIANMHGQYLMNKEITVQYAFKKDGKGERHGDAAERALAAAGRQHNIEPQVQPLPPQLLAPQVSTPVAPPTPMSASYAAPPPTNGAFGGPPLPPSRAPLAPPPAAAGVPARPPPSLGGYNGPQTFPPPGFAPPPNGMPPGFGPPPGFAPPPGMPGMPPAGFAPPPPGMQQNPYQRR
jgi:splicing factor 3B subunit 4